MGCPDWPKCFDQWVPPTHVSQLPADYQVRYADRGYDVMEFNPVKTWTEYLNRLTGSVIGLSVLIMAGTAIYARKELSPRVVWASVGVVALIGFQGWLGATVVASVLKPWVITTHMAVAILIIMILNAIMAAVSSPRTQLALGPTYWIAAFVLIIQFVLGSQVRQAVDHGIAINGLSQIGAIYWVHRSFSWVVVLFLILLAGKLYRSGSRGLGLLILIPLAIQMSSGIIFAKMGLVGVLQPLHLTAAAISIGTLSYIAASSKT